MAHTLIEIQSKDGATITAESFIADNSSLIIQITSDEKRFLLDYNQWDRIRNRIDHSFGIRHPNPEDEFEKGRESVRKTLREFKALFE